MTYLSQTTGYLLLIMFGLTMIIITYLFARTKQVATKERFLVAQRNINWVSGAASIAASWIWAPALFVSVQMAYEKGLAGIFWFTFPNVIALAIFAILAPTIRNKLPQGYTLPQYIKLRLASTRVHKIYLFPYFFYQLMAVTVQLYVGGNLVSLLTGIPLLQVMLLLAIIAIAYTFISGLEASIITDFIQIIMIVSIGSIVLPLTWKTTGIHSITSGLNGLSGTTNIFDPGIAFSFGIVTAIGLIAGAIADQQYWQRSFAIKRKDLKKAFIGGALLFAIVPIALSTLGFIAANPSLNITLPQGIDASMIGIQTIATLLPSWAVVLFVFMLLAGLSSTLDSGLSAASSLLVTDILKPKDDKHTIHAARYAIIAITIIGLLVALAVQYIPQFGLMHLWWIFNTIAACVMVPTILSLYWNRLSEKGVFWGVLTAFVVGVPLFIYSNLINDAMWVVGSSLFVVAVSTLFCVLFRKRSIV